MEAFGTILASKSRSKFGHDFGLLFCRSTGRGAASTRRRRMVDGSPGAADPPFDSAGAPPEQPPASNPSFSSQIDAGQPALYSTDRPLCENLTNSGSASASDGATVPQGPPGVSAGSQEPSPQKNILSVRKF